MLIAPAAASSPTAPAPQPLFNLHVIASGHRDAAGARVTVTDTVTFGAAPGPHGGNRITSTAHAGGFGQFHIRAYTADASERVAAQALADAIIGSGLIQQMSPRDHIGAPAAGLTRIYLDRRSRFIEFETGAAPRAAQAVLAALAAYRAIALR